MPPKAKRGQKALSTRNAKEPAETVTRSATGRSSKRVRTRGGERAKENVAMDGERQASKRRKKESTSEATGSELTEEDAPPTKRKRRENSSDSTIEETDRPILKSRSKARPPSPPSQPTLPISHHSHMKAPGRVMVIGQGDVGQLGLGEEMIERKKPFPVGGALEGKNVVQVYCGGMHTVALTDEGKVYTWGCNDEGALGHKTEEGEEYIPKLVEKLGQVDVVQISAGDSHTAALSNSGSVYCWGVFRDSNGPFGLVKNVSSPSPELVYSSNYNKAVKIVSGNDHVVILTEQGDVYTFGTGEQGQLGRVPECFSTRGGRKGISLLLHPQIVRFRKLRGFPKPKFSDVYCGSYHTFALTEDQGVYTWGLNNYGQLGTGDMNMTNFQPVRLPSDWIKDNTEHRQNQRLKLGIAGGQHHTLVCQNGGVYVVGRKEYGRLGLGENCVEPKEFQKVPDLENVSSVTAGSACSFAVTQTGEAFSWGMGTNLQLGTGEEEDCWSPVRITGKKIENCQILSASAGGQHTALLVAREPLE